MNYKPIIGLEVHVELKTKSKMFCSCSADYFGQKPNTHTCPVCLGMPGTLPVPNKTAIEWCIMIGLALNCKIQKFSKFDRKNYFYPDLAKGYQISQYDQPFCLNGSMKLQNGKTIQIRRVHMEEDTGKLTHATVEGKKVSLIDFNRSGVPLVEIVTEPDFETSLEVKEYLQNLQTIVRYLEVSNADMEKGDMRLEPNISLQKEGQTALPDYKVEVKNINSFRFVEKAIEFELKRQKALLDEGKRPPQETRGWDEKKDATVSQRIKEEANDYRYFPEPDIPPIRYSDTEISALKAGVPELRAEKLARFQKEYNLSSYDSEILTREKALADYFEEAVKIGKRHQITPKQITNAIINKKVDPDKVLPAQVVTDLKASSQIAAVNDAVLDEIIKKVIAANQKAVEDYRAGKEQVLMFLLGQVIKEAKTKLDAQMVKRKMKEKIAQ